MLQRWCLLLALAALVVFSGCERAHRYPDPTAKDKKADAEEDQPVPMPGSHYAYVEPLPVAEIPILFVHADKQPDEWKSLGKLWNPSPLPQAGARTAHLGLGPLEAVAALQLGQGLDKVFIKVPLGLPDPTPHIPASNPMTLAKWTLGKKLFHDPALLPVTSKETQSCVTCHDPDMGFTVHKKPLNTRFNPLSLINVVYNKHQFWDGRVTALEEVLQRDLADEKAPTAKKLPPDQRPEARHVWGGVVGKLRGEYGKDHGYRALFLAAFGTDPTQDNVGKALATYMRTLLSGNSIYDQAEQVRKSKGSKELTMEHLKEALPADALRTLGLEKSSAGVVSRSLFEGYELFHGRAGCAKCHKGPLFTDQEYHNLGIGLSNTEIEPDKGRFAVLPTGLKDPRANGAFRTPTLRALPRTKPFMHNGELGTITAVLNYYNEVMPGGFNPSLDPLLREPGGLPRASKLSENELRALELFLRSLDGDELPKELTRP